MRISNFILGERKVFVIAEIGNNHNGSLELALEMVDAANEAGQIALNFRCEIWPQYIGRKALLSREKILELSTY